MIPEDLLFWLVAPNEAPADDPNLLCVRHADAMVVPRGWTLDDRRDDELRLFTPRPVVADADADADADTVPTRRPRRRAAAPDPDHTPVQLQIDGTGEIPRPEPPTEPDPGPARSDAGPATPWQPDFDADDDLDGLLSVSSPLLARAFRGTDRRA